MPSRPGEGTLRILHALFAYTSGALAACWLAEQKKTRQRHHHPSPFPRRSPAEGAYSEGFIRAKFTQDFCIGGGRGRGSSAGS